MFIRVKKSAISIYMDNDEIYAFDREGRLIEYIDGQDVYKRGLNGRMLHKVRGAPNADPDRHGHFLEATEQERIHDKIHDRLYNLHHNLFHDRLSLESLSGISSSAQNLSLAAMELILHRGKEYYSQQASTFSKLYGKVPITPPDQYNCLYLQATEGCAYNVCSFCDFYRDVPFRRKPVDEFNLHVRDVLKFMGEGISTRRHLFLGDANALAAPIEFLQTILQELHTFFDLSGQDNGKPALSGVYSFVDTFMDDAHTVDDLRSLQAQGLRRVYIGLETGDPALRSIFNKPDDVARLQSHIQNYKDAGIHVGYIILAGFDASDVADSDHEKNTISLLHSLQPGDGDIVYLSPLALHDDCNASQLTSAGIRALSGEDRQTSLTTFRQRLQEALDPALQISTYTITNFLY